MKENDVKQNVLKLGVLCILWMQGTAVCMDIDMKPYWNDKIALENLHKG